MRQVIERHAASSVNPVCRVSTIWNEWLTTRYSDMYISLSTFLKTSFKACTASFSFFACLIIRAQAPLGRAGTKLAGLNLSWTLFKPLPKISAKHFSWAGAGLKPCWLLPHEEWWSRDCQLHFQGCSPLWEVKGWWAQEKQESEELYLGCIWGGGGRGRLLLSWTLLLAHPPPGCSCTLEGGMWCEGG